DWIFWHPGSKYEQVADAFQAELTQQAKAFQPPDWLITQVELLERQGVSKARESAAKASAARAVTAKTAGGLH
ncbi:MAG: hypothetical protein ACREMQ_14560, partial [Longimicrobiales bacterium]